MKEKKAKEPKVYEPRVKKVKAEKPKKEKKAKEVSAEVDENGKPKKEKKPKPPKAFIWNVRKLVLDFGGDLPKGRLALIQGLSIFGFILLGILMKLPPLWIIPLVILSLYFTPTVIYNSYKNQYEIDRFSDVNVYIEQMLYAFKNSKKILNSLEDVRILFEEGEMRSLIDHACYIISDPDAVDVDDDAEEKALQYIEEHYNNDHLKSLHRFLLKVERIGGEFDQPLELLLKDRDLWQTRVLKLQESRKLKKGEIFGSCLISMLICISLLYILPSNVDIAAKFPVRVANIVMVFLMGKIYLKAVRKLSSDLLVKHNEKSAEKLKDDYFSFLNYDPVAEFKKSAMFTLIPIALAVLNFFVFKITALYMVLALLSILTLCQHMIGHNLMGKRLGHEISLAFPQWLLELTLLLQSDNVQVSIFKTVENALPIMQPELEKLQQGLMDDPSSPTSYFNFFKEFKLPEITTSMQMLYALSAGSGGNSKEQIANIVDRNNGILDRAETKANNDSIAGLYALFLSPMLVSSLVLTLDMSLFLVSYLSMLSL